MNKFWNWIRDDTGGRVLRLEGPIDSESFWGDEITPQMFRDELEAEEGDLTVWINSPGGNVFAAAEIYTMLQEYKGAVTVKIASIAASAASVIAMAGKRVLMSPTALMEKAIETLNEVKESIINAYAAKSGMRRSKIAELMSNETWMNAKKAVELGFADEVLFAESEPDPEPEEKDAAATAEAKMYSSRMMDQAILNRLGVSDELQPRAREEPMIGMDGKTKDGAMPYEILKTQLDFLK